MGRQWEQTLDDWNWVLGVDLWGPINGIRAFVPRMLAARQPGHIVNTASLAGLMAAPLTGPYCAAKHAVVGISRSLRAELSDTDIDVSVMCPGEIRTPIMTGLRQRVAKTLTEVPDEIQATLDFLDSNLQASLDPAVVGELVVTAIRNNTFWIMPNAANHFPLVEADFQELSAAVSAGPSTASFTPSYFASAT
jgi:NAD(P)-dependent dehydrogenase (short-subunit alcohol dehydrogenase family)